MLPKTPVALQNPARRRLRRYRLYTNVQAARSAAQRLARFINNGGQANAVLCGKRGFRIRAPLDRVSVRAQHHSYTNKMTMPPESGYGRRLQASRLVHDDRCCGRSWRQDPLRCLSGDVLHQAGCGGRVRSLRQPQWRAGARRSAYRAGANGVAWRAAGAVPGRRRRLGRQARPRAQRVRHRDRRRHHLSRLQAGALHRVLGNRRRRHGHGGDRRHFLLLRRQGEDRHRSPSRPRDRDRPRRRARRSAMSRPANMVRRCSRSAACII